MDNQRQVVSISLPKKSLVFLNRVCRQEDRTRSEVIRGLLRRYLQEKEWGKLFAWGRETAQKFKIRSEADVLKLIND